MRSSSGHTVWLTVTSPLVVPVTRQIVSSVLVDSSGTEWYLGLQIRFYLREKRVNLASLVPHPPVPKKTACERGVWSSGVHADTGGLLWACQGASR